MNVDCMLQDAQHMAVPVLNEHASAARAFGMLGERRRFRMRSGAWLCSMCVLSVLGSVGCSQKDPGEDAPDDGGEHTDKDAGDTPSVSVKDDYYPLVAGSTLTYRHIGSRMWDEKSAISKTTWQGADEAYLTKSDPDPDGETGENTTIRLGTKLLRSHKKELKAGVLQGTVEYEPGFLRFDSAWTKVKDGYSEQVTYKRSEKTASGNPVGTPDDREHTFTVEKLSDSVTVPAGTFTDCMRVRRTRVRGNASKSADDDDKVFWFCRGIGKVKELSEIGGGTEELVSCKIPGGLCP
ncbi:MAG TPA: hypothetical protein VJR89_41325 [Polyangiales bacterium]|nr:hypothetical protein [Polyangiales bacterium]